MTHHEPRITPHASPSTPHAPRITHLAAEIKREGLTIVAAAFTPVEAEGIAAQLDRALARGDEDGEAIRSRNGSVYAARNVLSLWPDARDVWRRSPLIELLGEVLGNEFGLVRALYFDKPPDRTWSLPWHKDLTIAVRDNHLASSHFCKPTRKAGVPHVEAPVELLREMLTLRIHLDDATEENGPLRVIPGSHRDDKTLSLTGEPRDILVTRGDTLAIRPMVAHCSGKSDPDTTRHRRILHLEFAARAGLPDGYAWNEFIRGGA